MKQSAIQIIVPEGSPNGLKIVELSGWSGKIFVLPRNNLKDIKNRPEVEHPGIYFLFGKDDESIRQNVYIGESESFLSRLENHDLNKDFWNIAIVFTGGLNRADVKYLENKSTLLAKELGRYEVLNKVQPHENRLSEFQKIAVDDFFEKVKFILAVLGQPIFEDTKAELGTNTYMLSGEGFRATGQILDDGNFLMHKNSLARIRETKSFIGGYAFLARKQLLAERKIQVFSNDSYCFEDEVIFKSPSAAAAVITGRSINGWTAWKDVRGKTLDDNLRK